MSISDVSVFLTDGADSNDPLGAMIEAATVWPALRPAITESVVRQGETDSGSGPDINRQR